MRVCVCGLLGFCWYMPLHAHASMCINIHLCVSTCIGIPNKTVYVCVKFLRVCMCECLNETTQIRMHTCSISESLSCCQVQRTHIYLCTNTEAIPNDVLMHLSASIRIVSNATKSHNMCVCL